MARLLGYLMALLATAQPALAAPTEYDLKAAFLVNFVRFVEWPEGTSEQAGIVVVAPDPFGRRLDDIVRQASLPTPIPVRRLGGSDPVPAARVLFVSKASGAPGLAAMAAAGPATLTVGETEEFLARGGIVRLALVSGRIRIEINVDAAERSALRIPSRLMQLARLRRESELK